MATAAVISPVYATPQNERLKLFDHTVRSFIRQRTDALNLVHVVVDDGSSSDVEGFLREYHDSRIRYIRRDKSPSDLRTASNALNLGIDCCLAGSGDVFTRSEASDLYAIAFLHSDDLLPKDSVQKRIWKMGNGTGFVHTDMAFLDETGEVIGIRGWKGGNGEKYLSSVGNHRLFNHHTIMWGTGFLRYLKDFVAAKYGQEGVFDPNLSHGEDRDMSLSSMEAALEGGYKPSYGSFVSVFYRCHPKSITGEPVDAKFAREQKDRVFKKHFGRPEPTQSVRYLLYRMGSDPPYSTLTFLPEGIKRKLRPVRDRVRGWTMRHLHPGLLRDLEECLYEAG